MQLQFDASSVAVGASAYLLCWCISRAFHAHRWGKKTGVPEKQAPREETAICPTLTDDSLACNPCSEPVPEPAPEPVLEVALGVARVRRPACWWLLVSAGIAFAVIALRHTLQCAFLALDSGYSSAASVVTPSAQPSLSPELERGDSGTLHSHAWRPPQVLQPESAGLAPELLSCGSIVPHSTGNFKVCEAPLTVKLTRQEMVKEDEEYVRSAYYGTLMVGTPATPFTVVFDTGSGHLVLPSTYCHSKTCKKHMRYSRRMSSSGKDINYDGAVVAAGHPRDQLAVSFGTGEVTGVIVEDLVCMGNSTAARAMQRQGPDVPSCITLRIIAATSLSDDPFETFQFDGILGLGLEGLSQAPEFNFLNIVSKSMRDSLGHMSSTFGVFLAESKDEDSEIALGGWAQGHLIEELSWGPVRDPDRGHWIVPVHRIRVDDEILGFCEDGTCAAAVDTGTSLLAVPTATFSEIYESLRHYAPLSGHCRGPGPLLHIELEHFTVTLGPRDYSRLSEAKGKPTQRLYNDGTTSVMRTQSVRQDMRCVPSLMTLDLPEPLGPKLFIMGEPVLRKYYTVYDAHQKLVGFGRARHRQAMSREELLTAVPELHSGTGRHQRLPTMFDIFRWRKMLL